MLPSTESVVHQAPGPLSPLKLPMYLAPTSRLDPLGSALSSVRTWEPTEAEYICCTTSKTSFASVPEVSCSQPTFVKSNDAVYHLIVKIKLKQNQRERKTDRQTWTEIE